MYSYRAKLLRVIDGDTIEVDVDLGMRIWIAKERIRVFGIDTPELTSKDPALRVQAQEAKAKTAELLAGALDGWLYLSTYPDTDHFGRWLAVVTITQADGSTLNLADELLRLGLAKVYTP